ncbi:hypothetical protein TeGR_g5599, partial [Tetraparma gracilis]
MELFGTHVFDCTGVDSSRTPLGSGGSPALGEAARRFAAGPDPRVSPRIAPAQPAAGVRATVVGAGYSAATSVLNLLCGGADVTWVRRTPTAGGVYEVLGDDPLPRRRELCERANAAAGGGKVREVVGDVARLGDGELEVRTAGGGEAVVEFDRLYVNVGGRPDLDLCRELQVHTCYATEGPMK